MTRTPKPFTIVVDRLRDALTDHGVRLPRHALLGIAARATGHHNEHEVTAAQRDGLALPTAREPQHGADLALLLDPVAGLPFGIDPSALAPAPDGRRPASIVSPYGNLLAVGSDAASTAPVHGWGTERTDTGLRHKPDVVPEKTVAELLEALQSRGVVVSAWNHEDALTVLGNNEEMAELPEAEKGAMARALLSVGRKRLEDGLASRGWDILEEALSFERVDIERAADGCDIPGERLVRKGVKVEFCDLNESLYGDEVDQEDMADVPVLRFDVSVLRDGEWVEVPDSSYATQLPASTPVTIRRMVLEHLMDEIGDDVRAGSSVKRKCEDLSWLTQDWRGGMPRKHQAKANELDGVTVEEKRKWLESSSFTVWNRRADINPAHRGKWMVTDLKPGAPWREGHGWSIVGDDLNDLIREAYEHHAG